MIAECGTGKTLISLSAMHAHSDGRPFTALAMVPPHIVGKWAREALNTIPGIRVFLIDNLRNGGAENLPRGINEVKLRRGAIVRDGLRTTLTDLVCARPIHQLASAGRLFAAGRPCSLWGETGPNWVISGGMHTRCPTQVGIEDASCIL